MPLSVATGNLRNLHDDAQRCLAPEDADWIVKMMGIFSFLIPCPLKLFPPSEAAQAHAWIIAAS
jgi:hypothetical protein